MEFPHMSDTKFPDIDTVNVYKYQNNFDYGRWTGKVSIKLLNVLWNSDYADVVKFDSDSKRDEWFDSQTGLIKTLESGFNITPDNTVKIPVPYNDAYRFNYLVVDMPMQTSENEPLDYELENTRVKRWYYFIDDMTQTAPSTTELRLILDIWTTFVNTVDIPYLMLERGHAPMFSTTVENYLDNPIQNNEYLLAEDYNYGAESVIRTSNYKPIGNGDKYVLFVAPYSQSDFGSFGSSSWQGSATPPTFANEDSRWGYQLLVNGYEWKYGNTDYTNASLPIHNQEQNGLPNNLACYAIAGSSAMAFLNDCAENCVHFLHGIQAFFMLDGNLFNIDSSFDFRGYTLHKVSQKHNADDFRLTKSMFGFDSKYADIAKLYTFPYSELEVTDDEGSMFRARIENTGNMQIHNEVSLIYPYLNYNVFVSGINGNGTMGYVWKNLNGSNVNMNMYASDFSKFMMNWDVPVYGLFASAEQEYAANNAADMQARRSEAIKDYQNAVRFANTNAQNTADTMQTNTDNVAASGATNTTNVAASGVTNTANVAASGQTNTDNVSTQNGANASIVNENNLNNITVTTNNQAKIFNDYAKDNSVVAAAIDATATNMAIGAAVNTLESAAGGMISGGVAGMGIATLGSIGGTVTSVLGAGKNVAISSAASQANLEKAEYMANPGGYLDIVNESVRNTNSNNVAYQNAANTTNATRNQTTNNLNASRTQNTNNDNASRTQGTNNANASRSQNTETNNANWTRNAGVTNAQTDLIQKQVNAANTYRNERLRKPAQFGLFGGDYMGDVYKRRGIRFNVRTQSDSAIAQTGDAFLRFGYKLNMIWDMADGMKYGKHFTYWRANDIWVNEGEGLAGNAVNTIGDIFMRGVTVWNEPDEVGKVSIYDNM